MKMPKISEDINPWTGRLGQTIFEESNPPKSLHPALKQIRFLKASNNAFLNNRYPRKRIFPYPINSSQIDLSHDSHVRIPSRSQQIFIEPNIQKMPIRHKFIRFELKNKSDQQKRKEKHLPFTPNNLKQYIQEMPINSRNIPNQQENSTKYQKSLKIKRYFTEDKDYFDSESKDEMRKSQRRQKIQKQTEQSLIQHSEQAKKRLIIGVNLGKVARNKKQILSPDDITKHQKLYQQIRNICDSNTNSIAGHLSLMKKNYNLQKLQRLLRNQQTLQIKGNNN